MMYNMQNHCICDLSPSYKILNSTVDNVSEMGSVYIFRAGSVRKN
jgi:hypothetical protein